MQLLEESIHCTMQDPVENKHINRGLKSDQGLFDFARSLVDCGHFLSRVDEVHVR